MSEEAEQASKRDKFRQIAESRTNKAIEAIGRLGNLSNRQIYDWEEAEVKKVMKALRDAVSEVEHRFASPKTKRTKGFTL